VQGVLVTVALETGIRRSEAEGLTWDRVDLSRGLRRLEITKSDRRREAAMRPRVYDVLASRPGRLWPEGSTRAGFEAAVAGTRLARPLPVSRLVMMRGGSLPAEDLGPRHAGDDGCGTRA